MRFLPTPRFFPFPYGKGLGLDCHKSSGVNCSPLRGIVRHVSHPSMDVNQDLGRTPQQTAHSRTFDKIKFDGTKLSVDGGRSKTTTYGINWPFSPKSTDPFSAQFRTRSRVVWSR